MNQATQKVLDDMKKAGFDVSSFEQQAKVNPLLDRAADSIIGGGILRRQEFTQYKEDKDKELLSLQTRVRELASAHDSAEGFKENPELYQAALGKIKVLEDNLIAEGFDPDEVKNLSHTEKAGLQEAISQAKTKEAAALGGGERREGKEVPNDKDFIDSSTFQTVLANGLGGTLIGGIRAQHQLARAEKLGVELTDELLEKYERNLLSGLEQNKSYAQIADETFGLPAIVATKTKEAEDTRVESRARELAAEQLKEQGIPASRLSRNRPLTPIDTMRTRFTNANGDEIKIEGEGGTTVINGRTLPVNKFGNIEHYKLRSGREGVGERVAHASAYMNELEQKKPDLFEEPY